MPKSLTEMAKSVLAGETQIKESNDSAPDRDATKKTPNAQTLRPGSKVKEPPQKIDGQVMDLGGPLTHTSDETPGGRAADHMGKDHTKPTANAQAAEPPKKLAEDDDVEISEELDAFIRECVAKGMNEEEIKTAIDENFELVSEDETTTKAPIVPPVSAPIVRIDMSEHVKALIAGENLSEDFQRKAQAIFEAAVHERVVVEAAAIQAAVDAKLEEEVERVTAELTEAVDDYLNYTVETWMKENEVAIERSLRTELTESVIAGIRGVFIEHNYDIPEDKVDIIEALTQKNIEIENKLNESIQREVDLNKTLNEGKRTAIVGTMINELSKSDAERLKVMAEGVTFTTEEEFETKVKTIRENYFKKPVKNDRVLDETTSQMDSKETNTTVQRLGSALPKRMMTV